MSDWPMPNPPPYPADDEGRAAPNWGLSNDVTIHGYPPVNPPVPPPDVWEFYRRHGRWPGPLEA